MFATARNDAGEANRDTGTSSVQQRSLYAAEALGSGRAPAIIGVTRWDGELDARRLSDAWCGVLTRHEHVLGVRAPVDAGLSSETGSPPALPLFDLRQIDPEGLDAAVEDLLAEWAFGCEVVARAQWGALIDHALHRIGESSYVLLIALHHGAADATTLRLLGTELLATYEAAEDGHAVREPPDYRRFVEWQGRQDDGAVAEHFAGVLSGVRPLAVSRKNSVAGRALHVNRVLSDAARELVTRESAGERGVHATLLAASVAALARHGTVRTGPADVSVLTSAPGRPDVFADTIGCFVHTYPVALKGDLVGADRPGALRHAVERQLRQADDLALPFESARASLRRQPETEPACHPHDVYVSVDESPTFIGTAAGLRVEQLPQPITAARFPLGVVLRTRMRQPRLELVAESGVVSADSARAILETIEEILLRPSEPEHSDANTDDAADLVDRILTTWREVLHRPDMGPQDDFFASGGDSFSAVTAMTRLDLGVPIVDLFTHSTAASLAEHTAAVAETGSSGTLLRSLKESGSGHRYAVVGVPYGGGDAAVLRPLAQELPEDVSMHAVQLPGRVDAAWEPGVTPAAVASALAYELRTTCQGPIVLYGHCAGTAITSRLALELQRRGEPAALTVLAAAAVPTDPDDGLQAEQQTSDGDWADYLRSLGGLSGVDEAGQTAVLGAGRHDHRLAMHTHQELRVTADRVHSPVVCVFGDDDPATPDITAQWALWRQLAPRSRLGVLPAAGHYFVHSHARALAVLIDSTWENR